MRISRWLRDLDVDDLAEVCRARAEVRQRRLRTIEELARCLSDPESVAAAVAGLDRDAVLVAQSVVVLGDGCEVARLRAFVQDPYGVLDATLSRLAGRALVWPGEPADTLRFSAALGRYWRHPLDLGTPAFALANMMDNKDTVRAAARRLGVKVGNTRDDAARSVATALADPAVVARLVGRASAEAQALLDDLAYRPQRLEPPAGRWEPDRYDYRPPRPRDAVEQLYDLGLLLASSTYDSAELSRETALVLRGLDWGPQLTGPPTLDMVEVETAGAEMNALAAVEAVARLLARVERTPLPVLKKGGIGVRDLRRVAGEVGADQDATLLWLALADRAGLLGLGDDGYRPTRRYDGWCAGEACARWAALAEAWKRLGQRRFDPVPPPLPLDTLRRGDAGLREAVLAVLVELPERSAVAGDLDAVLAWRLPSADTSPARVAAVLAETDLLGLTAGGALSALGRGLVAKQAEQTARAVFPSAASTVVLQADLTAVAGGPVSAQTAATLDRLADRIGQGRWRFSRESLRRALDDGYSGDEIRAALESVAATGVPQPLEYLVQDLARVHGQMRVADCGCCVVADDPQVIAEIVALNLGLRRVAPTVAAGRDSAAVVLAALRGAGYAPVADPAGDRNDPVVTVRRAPESQPAAVTAVTADGIVDVIAPDAGRVDPDNLAARLHTAPVPSQQQVQALVDRLRDADSGLGFARLPDEEVQLLAEAAEDGAAVWIKYESVFSTSGKTSWLLLDELHIEPRRVVAWCRTRQKEESFPLSSIRSVELA